MNISRTLKIGIATSFIPTLRNVKLFMSDKKVVIAQVAKVLAEYFVVYSKTFKSSSFVITQQFYDFMFANTNASVDIGVHFAVINDADRDKMDFSYPLQFSGGTFMIRKPEYKPEIFGIFKTISFSVWITIFAVSLFMFLSYHFILNGKYAFHKVLLHVLAILLRQGSILIPSSTAENIVLYSWVVGTMVLCLAYDSVFLSFLAIPPVMKIKDVSDLAAAVENGEYHCISLPESIYSGLRLFNETKFKIIGENLLKVTLNRKRHWEDFMYDRCEQNFAFVAEEHILEYFNVGKKFVSDDTFLGTMDAFRVRRDFCCKKLLDTFVHRLMASGMFIKIKGDAKFLIQLSTLLAYEEKDATKRKLTLTDVAPAFIFLLAGYFMSCLAFIYELLSNRLKHLNTREKKKEIIHNEDSV